MKLGHRLTLLLAFSAVLPFVAGAEPSQADANAPLQLTTRGGDTYENCRIMKRTPEAVTILHDKGVTKINIATLGDEWREKFGYDTTKAAEFVKQEAVRKEQLLVVERQRLAMQQEVALANSTAKLAADTVAAEQALQRASIMQTYLESEREKEEQKARERDLRRNRSSCSSCYGTPYSYSSIYRNYYRPTTSSTRSISTPVIRSVGSVGSSYSTSSCGTSSSSSPVMSVGGVGR
jgi:hypothetical protein